MPQEDVTVLQIKICVFLHRNGVIKVGIGLWDPLRKSIGDAPMKHPFIYRGCLIGCFQSTPRFCRNLLGFSSGSTIKKVEIGFTPAERTRKTSDWKSVSIFFDPKIGGIRSKKRHRLKILQPHRSEKPWQEEVSEIVEPPEPLEERQNMSKIAN